jgi:hypothetical protein
MKEAFSRRAVAHFQASGPPRRSNASSRFSRTISITQRDSPAGNARDAVPGTHRLAVTARFPGSRVRSSCGDWVLAVVRDRRDLRLDRRGPAGRGGGLLR